jgi:hypothetical protein
MKDRTLLAVSIIILAILLLGIFHNDLPFLTFTLKPKFVDETSISKTSLLGFPSVDYFYKPMRLLPIKFFTVSWNRSGVLYDIRALLPISLVLNCIRKDLDITIDDLGVNEVISGADKFETSSAYQGLVNGEWVTKGLINPGVFATAIFSTAPFESLNNGKAWLTWDGTYYLPLRCYSAITPEFIAKGESWQVYFSLVLEHEIGHLLGLCDDYNNPHYDGGTCLMYDMGALYRGSFSEFQTVPLITCPLHSFYTHGAFADGVIDILDAIKLARHYHEEQALLQHYPYTYRTEADEMDINNDGEIDILDALLLAKYLHYRFDTPPD